MTATIQANGREYRVERTGGAGPNDSRYMLHGKRGARYALLPVAGFGRRVFFPSNAGRGFSCPLDELRFTDVGGELEIVGTMRRVGEGLWSIQIGERFYLVDDDGLSHRDPEREELQRQAERRFAEGVERLRRERESRRQSDDLHISFLQQVGAL